MRVEVDEGRARAVGRALGPAVRSVPLDPFDDPRYYPPRGASKRDVAAYFLVMVAMDHRLSRPGRDYEGVVDGELYHGADLLYRLGSKRFAEDRSFFEAERLAKVTTRDVLEWLTARGRDGREVRPPDPDVRAELLRDLGSKLLKLYDGDPYLLVAESGGYLRRGVGDGFVDRLKVFKAYQDPVEKKAFLLAKFLERRGVLPVQDPQDKELPIDNHLTRIAIRTGIVDVDRNTLERIALGDEFEPFEDVQLRMAARLAYRLVAQSAGVDPFALDDFLWTFGRRCCTLEAPSCVRGCDARCEGAGGCSAGRCVLAGVCRASADKLYMVPEHRFLETWWY